LIFAKSKDFDQQQRQQIKKALIERLKKMVSTNSIPTCFEWIEAVSPLFFQNFEELLDSLPKILHPEIITNLPPLWAEPIEVLEYFKQKGFV